MLTFVARNGPPEALLCPVFLCDVCLTPIQGDVGGDGIGGAVKWREDETGAQQVATVHKGRCNRIHDARHPGAHWLWDEFPRVIAQLVHNSTEPFAEERNVEYVAPRPSTWRLGRYERGR